MTGFRTTSPIHFVPATSRRHWIVALACICCIPLAAAPAASETLQQDHRSFYAAGEQLDVTRLLELDRRGERRLMTVSLEYNMVRSKLTAEWLFDGEVVGTLVLPQGLGREASFDFDLVLPGKVAVRFSGDSGQVQLRSVSVALAPVGTVVHREDGEDGQIGRVTPADIELMTPPEIEPVTPVDIGPPVGVQPPDIEPPTIRAKPLEFEHMIMAEAVTPDLATVYVFYSVEPGEEYLERWDRRLGRRKARLRLPVNNRSPVPADRIANGAGLGIHPRNSRLYLAVIEENPIEQHEIAQFRYLLYEIDPTNLEVLRTFTLDNIVDVPTGLFFGPDGRYVYTCAGMSSGRLLVTDLTRSGPPASREIGLIRDFATQSHDREVHDARFWTFRHMRPTWVPGSHELLMAADGSDGVVRGSLGYDLSLEGVLSASKVLGWMGDDLFVVDERGNIGTLRRDALSETPIGKYPGPTYQVADWALLPESRRVVFGSTRGLQVYDAERQRLSTLDSSWVERDSTADIRSVDGVFAGSDGETVLLRIREFAESGRLARERYVLHHLEEMDG